MEESRRGETGRMPALQQELARDRENGVEPPHSKNQDMYQPPFRLRVWPVM
jgi:hypothetical protein